MADEQSVFLLPGELTFKKLPTKVSTLLGSCVAVCLYDRVNRWGGMNHFMLPAMMSDNTTFTQSRFGDYSTRMLMAMAKQAGSRKKDLVASVFGGGRVAGHLGSMHMTDLANIGERNIEIAISILEGFDIPIVRKEVGGELGRKIHMDTATNQIAANFIVADENLKAQEDRQSELQKRKIKVFIVDDSRVVRSILRKGIELSPDMVVVGEAENPYDAREKLLTLDPDVMCLDIIMPKLDGVSFLRKVMQYKPIPTVIVSTIAKKGSVMWDKAKEAGAVDVLDKEDLEIHKGLEKLTDILLPKLRNAAISMVGRAGSR